MKYKISLFIFRRDLRLYDNKAFKDAAASSELIIPCFIFDLRQIGPKNSYRSLNALQFMLESLSDLEKQIKLLNGKLFLFEGLPEKVIETLIKTQKIDAVFCNRDYTPFSLKRDEQINKICLKNSCAFVQTGDALLIEPENILTASGTSYTIFTPFYKKASSIAIIPPEKIPRLNFYTHVIHASKKLSEYEYLVKKPNLQSVEKGGRAEGIRILKSLKKFEDYAFEKDLPAVPTTHLSAHLKFGTLSIRETYQAIKKKLGAAHPLLRQLFWRDFFTHVAYNSPFVFGAAFHEKYNNLSWSDDKKMFKVWCNGKTGFPLVDAGMRELNETGFMHNRVRMITGSFLVKDLHINWLWGEKYFAQQLVDYDPSVNNGNWQWVASTGCDAQPYFRIFNPWLQQKKFDPDCIYIKKWIPELKNIPNKIIHSWYKTTHKTVADYPRPILDHAIQVKKTKSLYRKVS